MACSMNKLMDRQGVTPWHPSCAGADRGAGRKYGKASIPRPVPLSFAGFFLAAEFFGVGTWLEAYLAGSHVNDFSHLMD